MRGGSIPVFAWGTLLLVLLVLNWIWTGDAIQVASFGFAVLAVYGFAVAFFVLHRGSVRRGPPTPRAQPEALPQLSLSAVGIGLSVAAILFGFVWATFLVYFGAGLLVLSIGRLVVELRAERESLRLVRSGEIGRIAPAPEKGGIVAPAGRGPDGTAAAGGPPTAGTTPRSEEHQQA